mmetsp:Transcript_4917/g.21990  ORF Transcript_4917/g.21990 Transcript_4917/m.21990 type:complete len:547 (+) Transcript_4917:37-1677(+)
MISRVPRVSARGTLTPLRKRIKGSLKSSRHRHALLRHVLGRLLLHRHGVELVALVPKHVTHLLPLGLDVPLVVQGDRGEERDAADDRQAESLEAVVLGRVVGHEPDGPHAQVLKDLRSHAVLARIHGEAEILVRLHGVPALILQVVRAELVSEADATALLPPEVHDDAPPLSRNLLHRHVQLVAAVAPGGVEDIPGEALAVHADQDVISGHGVRVIAVHERHVLDAVELGPVGDGGELPVVGGDPRRRGPLHQRLPLAPVPDEVGDEHHLEPVLLGELPELGQARHAAVGVVHDLAEDARGAAAGEGGEIVSSFGVTRALEHAALAVAQGKDVAGPDELIGVRVGGAEPRDGRRALTRGDTGGGPDQIARHGKRRLHGVLVLLGGDHEGQVESVRGLVVHGDAHQPAGVADHEVHALLGHLIGGADEVTLVLAILVVEHHHEPPGGHLGDGLVDGGEAGGRGVGILVRGVGVGVPARGLRADHHAGARRGGARDLREASAVAHRRREGAGGGAQRGGGALGGPRDRAGGALGGGERGGNRRHRGHL